MRSFHLILALVLTWCNISVSVCSTMLNKVPATTGLVQPPKACLTKGMFWGF